MCSEYRKLFYFSNIQWLYWQFALLVYAIKSESNLRESKLVFFNQPVY